MTTTKTRKGKAAKAEEPAAVGGAGEAPAPLTPRVDSPTAIETERLLIDLNALGVDEDRLDSPTYKRELEELARSMGQVGQLVPIIVSRIGDTPLFRVIDGDRRVQAARVIGWKNIDAIVRPIADEKLANAALPIAANVHRAQLTFAEESLGVLALLRMAAMKAASEHLAKVGGDWVRFGGLAITADTPSKYDAGELDPNFDLDLLRVGGAKLQARAIEIVAAQLGKDRRWVADRMYMARLCSEAVTLIQAGRLPEYAAREIATIEDPAEQADVAKAVAAGADPLKDPPASLEVVRQHTGRYLLALNNAPWKLSEEFAGKPSCETCSKNSKNQVSLFEHGVCASATTRETRSRHHSVQREGEAGICTDRACFMAKTQAARKALNSAATKVQEVTVSAPKADRMKAAKAATNEQAAELSFIRPSALAERVETKLARSDLQSSARKKPKEFTEAQLKAQLEERAARLVDEDRGLINEELAEVIDRAADEDKLLNAALILVKRSSQYNACRHWDRKKASKAARDPAMLKMAKLLASPSAEALVDLINLIDFGDSDAFDYQTRQAGLPEVIAQAMGLKVREPLNLADARKKVAEQEAAKAQKK